MRIVAVRDVGLPERVARGVVAVMYRKSKPKKCRARLHDTVIVAHHRWVYAV